MFTLIINELWMNKITTGHGFSMAFLNGLKGARVCIFKQIRLVKILVATTI